MSEFLPCYRIGDAVYFRYIPFDQINTTTGEVILQTPEVPAVILGIAHNFGHDIEIGPSPGTPRGRRGTWLPRVYCTGWVGFYYFVEIDQEEAALLGLELRYPVSKGARYVPAPLSTEVIKETQITAARIAF